eukprot:m51a1_g9948 hypothetical protein (183) ;mRNA; f:20152-20856
MLNSPSPREVTIPGGLLPVGSVSVPPPQGSSAGETVGDFITSVEVALIPHAPPGTRVVVARAEMLDDAERQPPRRQPVSPDTPLSALLDCGDDVEYELVLAGCRATRREDEAQRAQSPVVDDDSAPQMLADGTMKNISCHRCRAKKSVCYVCPENPKHKYDSGGRDGGRGGRDTPTGTRTAS